MIFVFKLEAWFKKWSKALIIFKAFRVSNNALVTQSSKTKMSYQDSNPRLLTHELTLLTIQFGSVLRSS